MRCRPWTDCDNDTTCRRQLLTDRQRAAECEGRENTTCHLVVTNTQGQFNDRLLLSNRGACHVTVKKYIIITCTPLYRGRMRIVITV